MFNVIKYSSGGSVKHYLCGFCDATGRPLWGCRKDAAAYDDAAVKEIMMYTHLGAVAVESSGRLEYGGVVWECVGEARYATDHYTLVKISDGRWCLSSDFYNTTSRFDAETPDRAVRHSSKLINCAQP